MTFFSVSALLFAGSTTLTIVWCASMSAMGMPMPGGWTMSMAWMRMPGQTWPGAAATFLGMWDVMMVAMMLPSLIPMLWRYRQVVDRTGETRLGLLTMLAGAGYFFVWTLFGIVVFPLGVALAAIEMQQPALARAVPIAVGVVVLIAGALQFSAWKARHLSCCREAPGRGRRLPGGAGTARRHGLHLGLHCSQCCAGLIGILLVVGVMDLRAMAVVAASHHPGTSRTRWRAHRASQRGGRRCGGVVSDYARSRARMTPSRMAFESLEVRMSNQRVVLITGASSGVGQSTARLLSQRGYTVLGTSRNSASAESMPGVEMLSLDVRADDSVQACVEAVHRRCGHLDVLINNAGYELAGALEELSPQEAGGQFETNFFGVVRMVNAVLPSMRQQKRGHIINVGSLSGLSAIPFLGIYSASKFALEGYTEALRHEVKPFNIHVSLTEAGFLKTPMMNHRQTAGNRVSEYDRWRQRALMAIRAYEERGPGPEAVAETLLEIISSSHPRLRYLIGQQARTVARLRRFLPARMYEQGVRRTFSLDSAG